MSESRRSRFRTLTSAITLIGASRQCELWLRDESVSGIHAAVVLTPDGAWVVDLLGRDGVLIDDQRVYWKQIREGSELQVGRFRFRVHVGSERKRASRSSARRRRSGESDRLTGGSLTGHSVLALVRQLAEMQNQFFEHSQLQMQLMSEMVAHLRGNEQASVRRDLARIDEIGRELRDIQIQLATGSAARPAPDPATVDVDVGPPAQSADAPSLRPAAIEDQRGKTPPKPPAYIAFSAAETDSNESDAAAAVDSETRQPDRDLAREPVNACDPVIGDRSEESLEDVDTPDVDESSDIEEFSEPVFDITADSAAPAPAEAFADELPSEESPDEPEASPRRTSPRGGSDDANDRLTRRMARLAQERNSRWRKVLQAFRRKSGS